MQIARKEQRLLQGSTGVVTLLFLFARGLKLQGPRGRLLTYGLLIGVLVLTAVHLLLQLRMRGAETEAEIESRDLPAVPASLWQELPGCLWDSLRLLGRHALLLAAVSFFDSYFYVLYRDYGRLFPAIHRVLVDVALGEGIVLVLTRFLSLPGGQLDLRDFKIHKRWVDLAFYAGFAYAFFLRFLRTTTWNSYVDDAHVLTQLYRVSVNLCLVIAVIEACRQRKHSLWLLQMAILATGFFHYKIGGQRHYIFALCVLIVAATGKNYRRILQISLVEGIFISAAAFAAAKAGLIKYIVRSKKSISLPRYGLGSISPTDFSAHMLYLGITWCMLRSFKKELKYYLDYLVLFACFFIAFRINVARTNSVMILLLIVGTFLRQTFGQTKTVAQKKQGPPECIRTGLAYLFSCSFAILFFYVLSQLPYKLKDMWMPWTKLVKKFTSVYTMRIRFRYAHRAYVKYPPTWFGNVIHEVGNGSLNDNAKKYTFIDISYARVLLVGGIALTIVLIGGMTVFLLRCTWHRKFYVVFLMTIVALNCGMEHHLFEYYYNMFPLLFFAAGFFEDRDRVGEPPQGIEASAPAEG